MQNENIKIKNNSVYGNYSEPVDLDCMHTKQTYDLKSESKLIPKKVSGGVILVHSEPVDIHSLYPKQENNLKNESKIARVEYVKSILTAKNIFFIEKLNGHLSIDGMSLWATTEKWYDPFTITKGKGINSFLKHLKDERIDVE